MGISRTRQSAAHRGGGETWPSLSALALTFLFFFLFASPSSAQNVPDFPDSAGRRVSVPAPAGALSARDTPNDKGESVDLTWDLSQDDGGGAARVGGYRIERSRSPEGPFEEAGVVPPGTDHYTDPAAPDGVDLYYRVTAIGLDPTIGAPGSVAGPVRSRGQWLDLRKLPTLIMTTLFCLVVILLIASARRGRTFYVRPIGGLSAVDEAIGRATEMGRPILFVPGLGVSSEVATLAAFTLLGRVARRTAEYQTQVLVPCYDPLVMVIAQEVVKSSYLDAGRPELYREDDIFFVTQDQFSYTAAVNGIMLRQRPATNFYIGKFFAESLVLAETGNLAGSIQIAGTDEITQIPFFVAACDYTLIGEELYASSAYLSQEPALLGTLKAQDYGKATAAVLVLIGAALAALGLPAFARFFLVE